MDRMDHIENQRVKYSRIGIMAEPPDLLSTKLIGFGFCPMTTC